MILSEKLNSINKPKAESLIGKLPFGEAATVEEFWDTFIVERLPKKEIVLKWHKVLMEYVKCPNATFAIRGYASTGKKDKSGNTNYDGQRRGFLTRTNQDYSFFYADNFHLSYYLKMMLDEYVPTVDELVDTYNARRFPVHCGLVTEIEQPYSRKYPMRRCAMPLGKQVGFGTLGYKIAHVLSVKENYSVDGKNIDFEPLCKQHFNAGDLEDWKLSNDAGGEYYLRDNFEVAPEARKYVVAEFLRFVHPFNYFFAPKSEKLGCSHTPVCKDIGEHKPLTDYVRSKFAELYGEAYWEFLDLVMPEDMTEKPDGSAAIELEYGLNRFAKGERHVPEGVEYEMIQAYLFDPETSFRKLELEFLEHDYRGSSAKRIINSFDITAEMKGILAGEPDMLFLRTASPMLREILEKIFEEV